jgi:diguanylate cyclase (GGDEF)-like protein/PAS domain S-box-containing protein
MLELDTRTLLVVTALVSMISALALIALWRAQLKGNGSGFWAAGMSCISIASILISGRGSIPDFISLVIANSLYVAGFSLFLRGICIFTGRSPLFFFDYILTSLCFLLFYYFQYVEQDVNVRIIIISIAFTLTCFMIASILLRDKHAPWRPAGIAVASVFTLFGVFHGMRGAIALLSPFQHNFLHESISSTLVFLVGIFILAGITITLILLVYSNLESRFRIISLAVEQSASSIIITDTKGTIDYVNPASAKKTGYLEEELIGENPRILRSGSKTTEEYANIWATISNGNTWRGEFQNRKKNGQLYWEIASITPVKQRNGEISHYVAVKEDITALKEAEKQILHLANHDLVTGLPTRRLAMERLISAISIAKRNKTKTALMFIDLDGFKAINDNYGHHAGDEILKETAVRLCTCVREVDTVARVGGDEFWVILMDISTQGSITKVAEKILDELTRPYKLKKEQVSIGASIGISISPDQSNNPETLIELADHTMYQVKQQGKNNYKLADSTTHLGIPSP